MLTVEGVLRGLKASRGPLPERLSIRERGVYALWLDEQGFSQLGITPSGQDLIAYVGVAGGAGGLGARFRQEWRPANSGRSSPRRTIGALLRKRLKLTPRPRPGTAARSSEYFTFGEDGEGALTAWIEAHATFGYLVLRPEDLGTVLRAQDVETVLIQQLRPPLNISKWRNPQMEKIAVARGKAARKAARFAAKL
jgi:hypothetical protein